MRVAKWMTPKPFTLKPTESISRAIDLMKEKKIRRIPIVSDAGKLVGIVSDRDLKDVSPSRATTLDIWELHYVLDKLKLKDVMTKNPWTVTPEMPIERAAALMLEKKVEGLPVLDEKGALVGILTEGDIFRALVSLTGVSKRRTRVSLLVPDKAGSIREVADICRGQGGTIFSILGSYSKVPAGKRELVMRVECPSPETLRSELSRKFGEVAVESD
ncbi:MAG TPA: CBS and ACT domain-containing protein [Thermoanaerobaculia bacterium]|nr:CBS and ACT domain-containing protein [Thermoanaerobaculia bacterium]